MTNGQRTKEILVSNIGFRQKKIIKYVKKAGFFLANGNSSRPQIWRYEERKEIVQILIDLRPFYSLQKAPYTPPNLYIFREKKNF